MCLRTQDREPRIAEKDIVCYKFLDEDLKSPYIRFQYKLGETYTEQLPYLEIYSDCSAYNIHGGVFHAYRQIYLKTEYIGFDICDAYKAIIPKGTEYWIGMDNDICARSIKIVRKIKWYDILLCTLKRVFSN